MSLAGLLNKSATIWRSSKTVSSTSAQLQTLWAIRYVGVPCGIQAKPGRFNQLDGAMRSTTTLDGFFPIGTDVVVNDRIEVGDDYSGDTVAYTVTSAPVDEAGMRSHLRCNLELVQGKAGVT